MKEIVIVGAGASGLAAAVTAAQNGAKVKVIEKNNKPGKKLLATGNGRCNITNLDMCASKYRGHNIWFVEELLKKYDTERILEFFAGLSVMTRNINGYVYPYSLQASTIVDKLVSECNSLGVAIITDTEVLDIQNNNEGGFVVHAVKSQDNNKSRLTYKADSVIISTGSIAGTKSKNLNDMFGTELAKKTGHRVYDIVPGLTGLVCNNSYQKYVSGVRWNTKVSLLVDNKACVSEQGELQFADYGISGIVVFQVSRYAALALKENKKVRVKLDFMPEYDRKDLEEFIVKRMENFQRLSIYDLLSGIFNSKLTSFILLNSKIDGSMKSGRLKNIDGLINVIKGLELEVTNTRAFEYSQVCAGGVDVSMIDNTMESKLVKGMYFTGEILDIDGICGGYNLHFAFATGIEAGEQAGKSI